MRDFCTNVAPRRRAKFKARAELYPARQVQPGRSPLALTLSPADGGEGTGWNLAPQKTFFSSLGNVLRWPSENIACQVYTIGG